MPALTRQTGSPDAARGAGFGAGFWIVGFAFAVAMAFSTVPAPLYVLYQARDQFSALLVTVIFAAYAIGVIASLFLAGHLSDWLGRRRMAVVALAINMLSGLVFLAWPSVPGLIAGRVICGISIGMITATATAYLSELRAAARPGQPLARAEITATAANLGGLGLGALLAGLLAQYAWAPLRLPYLVTEALMLAAVAGLALAPETVARPHPRPSYRPQRVSVPPADRSLFYAAGSPRPPTSRYSGCSPRSRRASSAASCTSTPRAGGLRGLRGLRCRRAGPDRGEPGRAAAPARHRPRRACCRAGTGDHRGLAAQPGPAAHRRRGSGWRRRRGVQGQYVHGHLHRAGPGPRRGAGRAVPWLPTSAWSCRSSGLASRLRC